MGSRENKLGMGQGFESSEPAPSMVLLPVRPHILDLHKLGNKCSNGKACGRGYFLIQTTTWVIGFIFCSTERLFRNSFSIPLWWSIVLFCYSSFRVLVFFGAIGPFGVGFYTMWEIGIEFHSFECWYPGFPILFIEDTSLFPMCFLGIFVEIQIAIVVWIVSSVLLKLVFLLLLWRTWLFSIFPFCYV